jgi:hypothetical protein
MAPRKPENVLTVVPVDDDPVQPHHYSILLDQLEEAYDAERWPAVRTAAIIAIKRLRHENECLRDEDLTEECEALEEKNKALRKGQAEDFREINRLREALAAAQTARVAETRAKASKALRIAQDRVQALEAQLAAWKAEPLISRILRAWRGI